MNLLRIKRTDGVCYEGDQGEHPATICCDDGVYLAGLTGSGLRRVLAGEVPEDGRVVDSPFGALRVEYV